MAPPKDPLLQSRPMSNLDSVLSQLRQERARLDEAISALEAITHNGNSPKKYRPINRVMSPAARRRIAAAQKARWAKWRKRQKAA